MAEPSAVYGGALDITKVEIIENFDITKAHMYIEVNGFFHRIDPDVLAMKLLGERGVFIKDDTTGEIHKVGIDNGRLYSEVQK